jgi:uncharacterized membrane protein YqaE (UPF0057 family)
MAKPVVCSACGHVGGGNTKVKGNIFIEIVLWLCFIVPGLIYSIWRSSSRYKACPSCGSTNLIPIDSPVGSKIIAEQGKTVEELTADYGKEVNGRRKFWLIVFAIILLLMISTMF